MKTKIILSKRQAYALAIVFWALVFIILSGCTKTPTAEHKSQEDDPWSVDAYSIYHDSIFVIELTTSPKPDAESDWGTGYCLSGNQYYVDEIAGRNCNLPDHQHASGHAYHIHRTHNGFAVGPPVQAGYLGKNSASDPYAHVLTVYPWW